MPDQPDPRARRRIVIMRDDGIPAMLPLQASDDLTFAASGLLAQLTARAKPPTLTELLADLHPLDDPDELRDAVQELITAGYVRNDLSVALAGSA